ncbi:MAG: hypothetical protein ACOC8D_02530 [bacterium]
MDEASLLRAGGGVIYAIFVLGCAVGALIVMGIQRLARRLGNPTGESPESAAPQDKP